MPYQSIFGANRPAGQSPNLTRVLKGKTNPFDADFHPRTPQEIASDRAVINARVAKMPKPKLSDVQQSITNAKMPQAHKSLLQHALSVVHGAGSVGTAVGREFERSAGRVGVSLIANPLLHVTGHSAVSEQDLTKIPGGRKIFGSEPIQSYQAEMKQHGGGPKGTAAVLASLTGDVSNVVGPGAIVKSAKAVKGIKTARTAKEAATAAREAKAAQEANKITNPSRMLNTAKGNKLTFHQSRYNDLEKEKQNILKNPTVHKTNLPTGEGTTPQLMGDTKFAANRESRQVRVKTGTTRETEASIAVSRVPRLREIMREQRFLKQHIGELKIANPSESKDIAKEAEKISPTLNTKTGVNEHEAIQSLDEIGGRPSNQGGRVARAKQGLAAGLGTKVTAIRKIGTKSAQELADRVEAIRNTHQGLRADYERAIPNVLELKKNEVGNFFDHVEKGVAPINDKVRKAGEEWKALSPTIRQDALNANVKVGHQMNFLPHSYDWNAIEKNPEKYDKILRQVVKNGDAKNVTEARDLVDSFRNTTGGPNRFGHFELSRKLNVDGYSKDLHSIRNYIDLAAKRTAEATHLGAKNEHAVQLINGIRKEKGNFITARDAVRNFLHNPDQSGTIARGSGKVRAVYGAARLPTAAIAHLAQPTNIAVRTNTVKAARALFTSLSKKSRQFAKESGVIHPSELHGLKEQTTGVEGKFGKVTAPGLIHVMRWGRTVAANAGRHYGNALAKAGKVDELRKLGVKGDIGKQLTKEQEYQAARGVVNDTYFSRSRAETPIKAETTAGRNIGQYRLAYAYRQTGFIYKHVIQEAKNGNIRPLIRYLGVSAPIGAATTVARRKIGGSKEDTKGTLIDAIGALGGLPGETAMQVARYGSHLTTAPGRQQAAQTVAGVVAPVAGEAVRAYEALGSRKKTNQYAAGLIPVGGKQVANAAFPTGSKSSRYVKAENPAVDKELKRLKENIDDTAITGASTSRAKKLSKQDYELYTHASAGLFADRMSEHLNDPNYTKMSDADKKAKVKATLRQARADVLDHFLGKPQHKKGTTIEGYK